MKHLLLLSVILLLQNPFFGQTKKFGMEKLLKNFGTENIAFCVPNNSETIELLKGAPVLIKYKTENWIYLTAQPVWIEKQLQDGTLKNVYLEFNRAFPMCDTVRQIHSVNPVHQGLNGLHQKYTGKNVIVGVVDQGLDWNHPDFKDAQGKTRCICYWDQSTNTGGPLSTYGYGIVWTKEDIDAGVCTSLEGYPTGHGTTVAGCAVGNARSNGKEKGMAPDAKIIAVETNFGLPNWTLTVADACDYIFKVADTLGLPAVVNLSIGDYLGSHDGNDPASEIIEQMLDEKAGRIVVCAAGNSGANGKYHLTGNLTNDTSFVWINNNTSNSAALGPNHIYVDIWTDTADAHFQFAYGADRPAPNYGLRGISNFHTPYDDFINPIADTIYNANGNRIATIQTYTELVGPNLHMQIYFSDIDSTNYIYRFITVGPGKYDAWSGAWLGLNNFVTTTPSVSLFPEIANYHYADSLQTIVSSWNCSEKVISVGNVRNRFTHVDKNGNTMNTSSDPTLPGRLAPSSSKGPNRHNVIKPDVAASGDIILASSPMWILSNTGYNSVVSSDGWHARNGGTSMASPTVAGIAALYLEKCSKANFSTFKQDLTNTTFQDIHTGTTPNNAYGYGKPHALNLLLANEFNASIFGTDTLCEDPVTLFALSNSSTTSAVWSNGATGLSTTMDTAGFYTVQIFNTKGCSSVSDTFELKKYESYPILPIFQSGTTLLTLSFTTYQWTLNGADIIGADSNSIVITPPYGTYTCYCISPDGCKTETPPYTVTANATEVELAENSVFPNPTHGTFKLEIKDPVEQIFIVSMDGKRTTLPPSSNNIYTIEEFPGGEYILEIITKERKYISKIQRL